MSLSPTPGVRSRIRSRRAFVAFSALVVALAVSLPVAFGGATAATAAVTNYAKFVGAKPGKANPKLKPVVIGMVNLQGGQVQVGPLWTPAVETAIRYANAELRGADGHPIILKKCFIKSAEEEGTKCGQQMANDKRVSVVLWGGVVIGNQSFYSAVKPKPVVGGVIVSPIDEQYKQGFGLFGSGTSVLTPYATFAKNTLKAKTAGVVYPTIPGIAENGVAIVNAMKKVGLSREAGRVRPEHDRPRRPDHGGGRPERRRLRAPGRRRWMREHGEGAHAAQAELEGADEPALPRPARGCRASAATTRSGRSPSPRRSAST